MSDKRSHFEAAQQTEAGHATLDVLRRRIRTRFGDTLVDPVPLHDDARTALIIVDMQYRDVPDTHHPDTAAPGWMDALAAIRPDDVAAYNERMESVVIPSNQAILELFRSLRLPVIQTVFGSAREGYMDVPTTLRGVVERLEKESGISGFVSASHPAFRIREELAPHEGEVVLRKSTWSGFEGTGLHALLQRRNVESLVVTGVTTPGCVGATARHGADLGYRVVIVADATADEDAELHELSLRLFHRKFGRVVESAGDIAAALEHGWAV
jgi:nicotinamidase-related amidase